MSSSNNEQTLEQKLESLVKLSNKFKNAGKYKMALNAIEECFLMNPDDLSTYYDLRAQLHILMSNYELATQDADKLIALKPEWPTAIYRRALCYSLSCDFSGSYQLAMKGLEIEPENTMLQQLADDMSQLVDEDQKIKLQKRSTFFGDMPEFTEDERLPVTVLSGFLGAGKTTLLKYIMSKQDLNMKIAIIVNDVAEINIDGRLIKNHQAEINTSFEIAQYSDQIVELTNGCICCDLKQELLVEIAKLAKQKRFDYLLIETTGVSEPLPVAQMFSVTDGLGKTLSAYARLDTMVTMVDCFNFFKDYYSPDFLKNRGLDIGNNDNRHVVDLLTEQIEFANVIVLNKTDLITSDQLVQMKDLMSAMNRDAIVIDSQFGVVDLNLIMNTMRFDFKKAIDAPGWIRELRGDHFEDGHHHPHPNANYHSITSFVYKSRRPFHEERLCNLAERIIDGVLTNVVRSKGFFWIACDNENYYEWSTAGSIFTSCSKGKWIATVPDVTRANMGAERWKKMQEANSWQEPFGDRRQELVFIGTRLDQPYLENLLHECLLTDEELHYFMDANEEWVSAFTSDSRSNAFKCRFRQEHSLLK